MSQRGVAHSSREVSPTSQIISPSGPPQIIDAQATLRGQQIQITGDCLDP